MVCHSSVAYNVIPREDREDALDQTFGVRGGRGRISPCQVEAHADIGRDARNLDAARAKRSDFETSYSGRWSWESHMVTPIAIGGSRPPP